jgi:hypothetical protein
MPVMGVAGVVLCLVVGLWGCAPADPGSGPQGPAELRVSPGEVSPGDEVMITLLNRSERELGYNLCVAVLDRREGEGDEAGEWVEWPDPPAEICTMELRVLDPGNTSSFRHTIPGGVTPGEYRFRTGVESPLGEGRVDVVSDSFRITD